MADKAISLGKGFNGGTQVTLYGDSFEELHKLLSPVYGEVAAKELLVAAFQDLASNFSVTAAAVSNVNAQLGPVTEVAAPPFQAPYTSTVGVPLAQPTAGAVPTAAPVAATPPGLNYPGNCQHGQRTYKDSMARGRAWRRWECAIPWSKGVEGRCTPVNVDA
jgi:hypothetical protein